MSVVSIHPEDLLDKLSRGGLSPAERELLEAHLSSCDVCRFELAVSVDFQNEARAVAAKGPALLPQATLQPERAQADRRRSRRVLWASAAALLIASTGAVASTTRVGDTVVGLLRFGGNELPAASGTAVRNAPVRAPESVPAPPATAQPSAAAPPVALAAATPKRAAVSKPAPAASSDDDGDEPAANDAESLFAEANKARRRGDLAQAGALYRELQKKFPSSQEAALSQVTLSMLLLDRGDAAGALAGFDKYLTRGRRPLEAEALVGRARALGALGSPSAEARAWREVQRKYPSSVYARQAADRLAALGQP